MTDQIQLQQDPHGAATQHRPSRPGHLAWWPSALGLALALIGGVDSDTSATLASVVLAIALIYVGVAALGRPGWAWLGFALSIPVVLSGPLTGWWALPFAIMAVLALGLFVLGAARQAWAEPRSRMQVYALLGFGAIALAGALTSGTVAAVLIAAGLLAHSVWDVIHHRCALVVERRYAEFCAALDAAIAATIIWGIIS